MSFNTHRYAAASAAVCAHGGTPLRSGGDARLVQIQRDIGEARRALDALAAEVAGEIQALAEANPGPGGIVRQVGYRDARQMVADTLGTSVGEAQRLVNVGKALAVADAGDGGAGADAVGGAASHVEKPRGWPLVAAALRAGEITVEKSEIVIETLDDLCADEEGEAQFVRLARRLRPYELRRVCANERLLRDPAGAEERDRKMYEARTLTLTERKGMTVVDGLLDPASAGHLKAWLDAQVRAAFQAKRETPGDLRTPGQMRVDALAMLAHHAMGCEAPGSGVKTTLVLRTSVEELERRVGTATCDALQTRISLDTLRAMAVDLQVLPMVMGGDSMPLNVGRTQRCATPYQRMALLERDGGCAWCHAPASYCDAHHIRWWKRDHGPTDLNNMVMLCVSCHHRMHYGGWDIEVGKGVVWFTPPAMIDPQRTRRKGGLAHLALAA